MIDAIKYRSQDENASQITLIAPAAEGELSLQPPEASEFWNSLLRTQPHKANFGVRETDGTIPPRLRFVWRGGSIKGIMEISEQEDFQVVCRRQTGVPTVEYPNGFFCWVTNLIPGRRYYWRVTDGELQSPVRSFSIRMELPRWIHIPCLTNVRDCGGWQTQDGRKIRFGMLYRGSQFEPWTTEPHGNCMTPNGETVFFEELGIRTEIDLRKTGSACLRHPGFQYQYIPCTGYSEIFSEAWQEQSAEAYRKICSLLANPENYPVYYHCQGGGDRTGCLGFFLGALLGMTEEDLLTDYEFSTLSLSGERNRFSRPWKEFRAILSEKYPGKNSQEQTVAYLLACGVPREQMQQIRDILLE